MTYITDITLFSIVLCVISLLVIVGLAWKLNKFKPQIEDALSQVEEAISQKDEALAQIKEALSQKEEAFTIAEDIYAKSKAVTPLVAQLQDLFEEFNREIAKDGEISIEEFQALVAKGIIIVKDPAVKELIDGIEGYTCSEK